MKAHYERLIAEHDKTILFLKNKMDAAAPAERAEWKPKIDSALDERLRLMKLRDNAPMKEE